MIECAQIAGIHDEIMAMPMTYNSLIGDMGSSLSGGQKQRVLLARALYRQPKLLFLDEGTAHLDVPREAEINANLRRLGMTLISVAHRPGAASGAACAPWTLPNSFAPWQAAVTGWLMPSPPVYARRPKTPWPCSKIARHPLAFARRVHRFPQIGAPLHIQPEVRAVTKDTGKDERRRRGHRPAIVA